MVRNHCEKRARNLNFNNVNSIQDYILTLRTHGVQPGRSEVNDRPGVFLASTLKISYEITGI